MKLDPSRVADVRISLSIGTSCRIFPKAHRHSPLGTGSGVSRFRGKDARHTVLYVAEDFETAFLEVVARDRFSHIAQRRVPLIEVQARVWGEAQTRSGETLNLIDLRDDGCFRLGVATDTAHAKNHAAGRALGRAVHEHYPDIDGFVYESRLSGRACTAIYDWATAKLDGHTASEVIDHPQLPGVLGKDRIKLISRR